MHTAARCFALFVLSLLGGCSFANGNACRNVTCSGHGSCVVVGGAAACSCDNGFHADGLSCIADPGGFAGSCTGASGQFCVDYTGSAYTAQMVQSVCAGTGISYSSGHCDSATDVGNCRTYAGSPSEAVTYWYPPADPWAMQSQCAGQWSPG